MNLSNAINSYKEGIHLIKLHEMKSYYESITLPSAVIKSSIGLNANGKMNGHQRRIGKQKGKIGARKMLRNLNDIRRCESFEDIFSITEKVKRNTKGLGDLWSYDTALRIGFNRKFYPKNVYVQSGVVKGVIKALGSNPGKRNLPLAIFPAEFQTLNPFEAENFLCIWGKERSTKSNC